MNSSQWASQHRAAMAQAALINFFSRFRHHQQYYANSSTITITDLDWATKSTYKWFWGNSFKTISKVCLCQFLHNIKILYNNSPYTISIHITLKKNIHKYQYYNAQKDYNKTKLQSTTIILQSSNPHSYSDRRRVRRQNTHNHHKDRKHPRKDDRQ